MNGTLCIISSIVLAGTLASCKPGQQATTETQEQTQETTGLANPWHTVTTADEAAAGAGVGTFMVPDALPISNLTWISREFSCMEGIAQASYDAGAVGATVRKGVGLSGGELHGVYDSFETQAVFQIGDLTITCQGHVADVWNLLTWERDGASYSVYVIGLGGDNFGVTTAEVAGVVDSIR